MTECPSSGVACIAHTPDETGFVSPATYDEVGGVRAPSAPGSRSRHYPNTATGVRYWSFKCK